jgi:hypothetical protein
VDGLTLYTVLWWCVFAMGLCVVLLCIRHERRMDHLHERLRRPEYWRAMGRKLADEGRMEEAVRAWERMRGPIVS